MPLQYTTIKRKNMKNTINPKRKFLAILNFAAIGIAGIASTNAATLWTDDFTDGNDTSNPAWIHTSSGGSSPSWSVVNDGSGNNIYQLSISGNNSTPGRIGSYVAASCPAGTPSLLTRERWIREGGNSWWVSFAATKLDWLNYIPTLGNGYAVVTDMVDAGGGDLELAIRLSRFDGPSNEVVLDSMTLPFTENWFFVSFQNFQGDLAAKWWLEGDAEPTQYQLQATDTTYSSYAGYAGVEFVVPVMGLTDTALVGFDNIIATPEPTTIPLIVLGLVFLPRRKRSPR